MALAWIFDDAVLAMAGLERRLRHKGEVFGRNPAVGRGSEGLLNPDPVCDQFRPEIRGITGDDAVVVLWETLSLHQGFPAAV